MKLSFSEYISRINNKKIFLLRKLLHFHKSGGLKLQIKPFHPFVMRNKFVILISVLVSFFLVTFVIQAIKIRDNFIASNNKPKTHSSDIIYYSSSDSAALILKNPVSSDSSILGTADESGKAVTENNYSNNNYIIPTSPPINTQAPLPTLVPIQPTDTPNSSNTSASSSCDGTPTAYNSEAIVSAGVSTVNNPVTIEIQLLDCRNNYAPVNDDLKISLSNSDATARINGGSSPANIKAQNGKATVTVNSQTNITDTFVITDTTRQFNVTDPHNHNPSVTFSNNTSGNSNCTTAAGVPNFWYSNVSPALLQTSPVGNSFSFNVQIKDCSKNIVSRDESLNITLVSGNNNSVTVNGHSLPYSITAHSGQINLSVNSSITGTVTIAIYDSSSSFSVTDSYNNNASVNFTSQSSPSSAPTPTTLQPTVTTQPTQIPTLAPTSILNPTPTSGSVPIPTVTVKPT